MTKEEEKEWYKAVDCIKKEMQFYSKKDFYNHSNEIIYYFKNGNSYLRQLYMWYVYSNPNIKKYDKTEIWTFLTK